MTHRLALALARLTRRERLLLAVLAFVVLPAGLAFGVAQPLQERRATAQSALDDALAQRAWLDARRAELGALPAADAPAEPAHGDPIGLSGLEASLTEAGLRDAVEQISGAGGDGVTLRFGEVAFTRLMPWLDDAEAEAGYRLATLRIERGASAATVAAEVVLEPRT